MPKVRILPAAFFLLCLAALPPGRGQAGEFLQAGTHWYLNVYAGIYSPRDMGKTMLLHPLEGEENFLLGLGLGRELVRWKTYLSLEVEALVANHFGVHKNPSRTRNYLEYVLMANLRYQTFPWDRYVKTTLAIGDGFSYAEEKTWDEQQYGLNYLQVEVTFAPPKDDRLAFVYRIHHRSGVFGLVGDGGANFYTFGLRYRF